MLGATLAVAAGAQRRHGWGIVAAAAVAAALPDWDGLSLLFGATAYDRAHRLWGHNFLVAGGGGLLAGGLGYLCVLSAAGRSRAEALLVKLELKRTDHQPTALVFSPLALGTWLVIGLTAGLSHLPADAFYGGGAGTRDWPLRPLWPFSRRQWSVATVPWGDLGTTAIFIVEMFAIYRWPNRSRIIAVLALLGVVGYIALRAVMN